MAKETRAAHRQETWPESTTAAQLASFATGAFSNALILFIGAERSQDTEAMNLHAKTLRQVVTRIDQFRRMRVRQWRVQPESYRNHTSSRVLSGT